MEPNKFENAVGQAPHEPELPELAVRALSDFERVVAAEARLFETNLVTASNGFLERLYIQSILIVVAAVGMVTLFVSVALILHQWLRWWQVMGILGACLLVAAEVLRRALRPFNASVS